MFANGEIDGEHSVGLAETRLQGSATYHASGPSEFVTDFAGRDSYPRSADYRMDVLSASSDRAFNSS